MVHDRQDEGFAWQQGVWDKMAEVYEQEIDSRFVPVVECVLARANLQPGETALDLGTGTGSVAFAAAARVGAGGRITAVDISPEMLAKARAGAAGLSLANIDFEEGRGEAIPAPDRSHDAVLASLSLMYVIDRAATAREIARVLRPGGRLVAAVWAGPDQTDIVQFQQIAGSFAPAPPVEGVGPGVLADPSPFLVQLAEAGLKAHVETETTEFRFNDFGSAWNALAGVTTAALDLAVQNQAKSAVRERMWSAEGEPRVFRNTTQFIIAKKSRA
jgi:SAM-dependent methyltransferase